MTIENTYIVDRNLKTVVDQLEDVKELLSGGGGSSDSGAFIIEVDDSTKEFNKTYKEIKDAYYLGKICIIEFTTLVDDVPTQLFTCRASVVSLTEGTLDNNPIYQVVFINSTSAMISYAVCNSENDYPVIDSYSD